VNGNHPFALRPSLGKSRPRDPDPVGIRRAAYPAPRKQTPIFIGHYWLPPERPAPLTPTIACLDYSVAAGGPLVAYRWDSERHLRPDKFVFDPTRLHRCAETDTPVAVS